jgi:membrane protease YdiL (CAAX protease family)
MTDATGVPPPQSSADERPSDTELIGVWLLIVVVVLPSVFTGLDTHLAPSLRQSYRDAVFYTIHGVTDCALVAFIAWKAAVPLARLGLVRPRWVWDISLGLLLAGLTWVVYQFAEQVIGPVSWDVSRPSDPRHYGRPVGVLSWVTAIVRSVAIGFGEELAFRGFLLPSLVRVLKSRGWGVVVSAVLFGSVHLYQGAIGVMGSTLFGALMAVVFLTVGRIWPAVVAHSAYGFWASIEWDVPEYTESDWAKPGSAGPVNW